MDSISTACPGEFSVDHVCKGSSHCIVFLFIIIINSVLCAGVQPPDEYADSVNNSAFTNMIASISLEFASDVAKVLKLYQKQKLYDYYAQRIYIPFNDSAGFHPEYDGFKLGE